MIEVKNRYDFTVEELTDILNNTPIKVDLGTNDEVAKYIIQALNINAIIKGVHKSASEKVDRAYHVGAPYHVEIVENETNKRLFSCDARTVAFYAYDPLQGKPHKVIISQNKPTPIEIASVCEHISDVNGWGTVQ